MKITVFYTAIDDYSEEKTLDSLEAEGRIQVNRLRRTEKCWLKEKNK